MRKNVTRILFGVAGLGLGCVFLLAALDVLSLDDVRGWWTLLFIIPAIGSMVSTGVQFWNTGLLATGIWLFLWEQKWIDHGNMLAFTVAMLCFTVGFWLVFGGLRKNRDNRQEPPYTTPAAGAYYHQPNPGDAGQNAYQAPPQPQAAGYGDTAQTPRYFCLLGGKRNRNVSQDLRSCSATAILGGLDVDLVNADIRQPITIVATSILGGVDVYLPKTVRLEMDGTALLAKSENRTQPNYDPQAPVVTIKYFSLLGGITVQNG